MARKKLKEIVGSSEELEAGLIYNGERHKNYRVYVTMEEALDTLLSGYVYLSNGKKWNDISDRKLMEKKGVFAKCFSCSERENVAMWMLYNKDFGKGGASLIFTPSMLRDIISAEEAELLKCSIKNGEIVEKNTISSKDYRIFLTDVLYTDKIEEDRCKITQGEEHEIVSKSFLENNDKMIFYKDYAWHYEAECRLVMKIDQKKSSLIKSAETENTYPAVRIKLPDKYVSELKNRLTRSPVYCGKSRIGERSALDGKVDWEL